MNALVLANFPIALLIFAAVVGIPLWMTFKHPSTAPDYSEARAYYRAKAAAATHTSDFVPTTRVAAVDGLAVARQHLALQSVVPGRHHAAKRALRTHTPGAPAPATGTRSTPRADAQTPGDQQ
jgi:hypothetical protein